MSRLPLSVQAYLSTNYWRYTVLTRQTGTAALAWLGALWLPVVTTSFFASAGVLTWLKSQGVWFLMGAILGTLWSRRPGLSVRERLRGRDVAIEVRVTDMFRVPGAIVVPTNTTFDTDVQPGPDGTSLIAPDSVQGAFTSRHYSSVQHLDHDIEHALQGEPHVVLHDARRGKSRQYAVGTVARLANKGRSVYLLAIAEMNEHGTASSSFDFVKQGLASLWDFLGRRGDCEPIVIPLLGTGRGRISVPRSDVVRAIILSFIAACADRRFTPLLTVAISPSDYREHQMDLAELGEYLRYVCRYTELKRSDDVGSGRPLS